MKKDSAKPKVSIIVPIYGVEKYLEECLDSIVSQTLNNIEIILIDDGSPDSCGKIVDSYAKKDVRIVPVHQNNRGYSATVDRGIKMARGEYIGIIESDDWIEKDMYSDLYADAVKNKTDITKGEFYLYNSSLSGPAKNTVYKNPGLVNLDFAPDGAFSVTEWPEIIAFHSSIWSSIYRSDFVKNIKFSNTPGASYQDLPFMITAMLTADRISIVKKPFVHWRNDPGQNNSTSSKGKKLFLMIDNTKKSLDIVIGSGKYNDVKEAFFAQAFWSNINFFNRISLKYKKEYYDKLRTIFEILKDDKDFKYIYFRPEDILCVKSIIKNKGWAILYMSFCFGWIRRKINRTK